MFIKAGAVSITFAAQHKPVEFSPTYPNCVLDLIQGCQFGRFSAKSHFFGRILSRLAVKKWFGSLADIWQILFSSLADIWQILFSEAEGWMLFFTAQSIFSIN